MRIKAAVLNRIGLPPPYSESRPLEVVDLDLAPPGRGELLVRIAAAGLCHSDLSVIDGSRPRPVPMAIGHEAAGVVEALGEGVTDLSQAITSCWSSSRAAAAAALAPRGAQPFVSPARKPMAPGRCFPESGGSPSAPNRSTTISASRPSRPMRSSRANPV